MHELSIAYSLVESAETAARNAGARRVAAVHVDLGKLSGVVKDALLFSYDIASKDTPLEGTHLIIRELPVIIHCDPCDRDYELPGVQSFRCPVCNQPSHNICQGKELTIVSLEVDL